TLQENHCTFGSETGFFVHLVAHARGGALPSHFVDFHWDGSSISNWQPPPTNALQELVFGIKYHSAYIDSRMFDDDSRPCIKQLEKLPEVDRRVYINTRAVSRDLPYLKRCKFRELVICADDWQVGESMEWPSTLNAVTLFSSTFAPMDVASILQSLKRKG